MKSVLRFFIVSDDKPEFVGAMRIPKGFGGERKAPEKGRAAC